MLVCGLETNSCSKIMCISHSFSLCCAFVSFCANYRTFSMGSIRPICLDEFRFSRRGKTM